jgi:hypothetical protein
MTIIFCWTYPQTRSFLLDKIMSRMVHVIHEPFSNPQTCTDFQKTIENIQQAEKSYRIVYITEFAYGIIQQWKHFTTHLSFFRSCKHFYFIRPPQESVLSLVHQIKCVDGSNCSAEELKKVVGIEDLLIVVSVLPMLCMVRLEDLVNNPRYCLEHLWSKLNINYNHHHHSFQWSKDDLDDDCQIKCDFAPTVKYLIESQKNVYKALIQFEDQNIVCNGR